MTNRRRKQPVNKRKFIVIGLVLLFGISLIIPMLPTDLFNKPENDYISTTTTNIPQFKKEGNLSFIKKNTEEIIKTIDIEIADTEAQREQGLMYRRYMSPNQGMLFTFDAPKLQAFWMKNTYISLDILYIDENNKIVKIYPNTETLSERSLPSNIPAKYVVEVVAGFCKSRGIEEGDFIKFESL